MPRADSISPTLEPAQSSSHLKSMSVNVSKMLANFKILRKREDNMFCSNTEFTTSDILETVHYRVSGHVQPMPEPPVRGSQVITRCQCNRL